MFVTDDHNFPTPLKSPPSLLEDRLVGTLVMLGCMVLCLVLVLGLDNSVIQPANATYAVTLTHEARTTATPRTPTPARSTRTPRPATPAE